MLPGGSVRRQVAAELACAGDNDPFSVLQRDSQGPNLASFRILSSSNFDDLFLGPHVHVAQGAPFLGCRI